MSLKPLDDDISLQDALKLPEKKGLIESKDQFRQIRALRDDIIHEFAVDNLAKMLPDVLKY